MKWRAVGFLLVVVVFAFWIYDDQQRRVIGVSSGNNPTPVLVAKQLIPKGTPGSLIVGQEMYVLTTLPRKEVEDGTITNPLYLSVRVAAVDIVPGQQLTETDFAER